MSKKKLAPKSKKHHAAFFCATCRGVRLTSVIHTRQRGPVIVRFRRCSVCCSKIRTVERVEQPKARKVTPV